MRHEVKFQIWYDGDWHDVPTRERSQITITRGRQDQLSRVTSTTLSGVEIDNRDGTYSPRNAMSPLWGKIGRNTRCRLIVDGSVEFVGEVESWPPRTSPGGYDVWVPVTAHGIMHRLGMPGQKALAKSPARRTILATGPAHFWPLDDGKSAEIGSSALSRGTVLTQTAIVPEFDVEADAGVVRAIDISDGGQLDGQITMADTGEFSMSLYARLLMTATDTVTLMRTQHGTEADPFNILINTSFNGFLVQVTGAGSMVSGTLIPSSGEPESFHVAVTARQNGTDVDLTLRVNGVERDTLTATSVTLRPPHLVRVGWDSPSPAGSVAIIGQVALYDRVFTDNLLPAFLGYVGEQAHERIERICNEEGIDVTIIGSESAQVGPQPIDSVLEILFDSANVDHGILYEPRDAFGVGYRCHSDLYNQTPALSLTYGQREIGGPLEPSEDLDFVQNDVTVRRPGGGSARAVQETGPMNVQEPVDDPEGVGRFSVDYQLNLYEDRQADHHAGWLLHLGTVTDLRYPAITVDLDALRAQGKTALAAAAAAVDVGDRIVIINPPAEHTTDPAVNLMIQGLTQTVSGQRRWIEWNCVPYGPWRVGVYAADDATSADNPSRYQARGCVTRADFDTAADSTLLVDTPEGGFTGNPDALPYRIRCAGVVFEVTAVSAPGATQDLTVTVLNGVNKVIPAGSPVEIHYESYYAL